MQNPLKPYVQALMQGMPQKCKMPLYEYGSKGVLGFYQAQLAPVVTYRDLQTDVFQSFKEVGNTVIFCLQLEKALVSWPSVYILYSCDNVYQVVGEFLNVPLFTYNYVRILIF